jgi:hypothetical protein
MSLFKDRMLEKIYSSIGFVTARTSRGKITFLLTGNARNKRREI